MKTKEIMCREDFEREFHVRIADKCCANCKHGECEYEGCATCSHPERNDGGYTYDEDSKYYSYNTHQCDLCDLWEKKEEKK